MEGSSWLSSTKFLMVQHISPVTLNFQGRFRLEITKKFQGKGCKALKGAAQSGSGVTTHRNVKKCVDVGHEGENIGRKSWLQPS